MIDRYFTTEKDMQTGLFYIMAIAAGLANLFGFLLNAFLYRNTLPTKICILCGIICLVISLFGLVSKYKKSATIGLLVTVIWIEFPLLYSVYSNVILVYFVLSIFGIVAFFPRRFSILFSLATIIWDVMIIILIHFYPRDFRVASDQSMLIFSICSYLIVALAVLFVFNNIIGLYERQKEELFEMNEQLYFVATHDPLTKLYNREYLIREMEKRMQEDGAKFIAVILDVDNFKGINDTYGHTFGDHVLMEFAHIMEKEVEGKGFAARYGGEEFMLIFDNANQEEAMQILDNISMQLKDYFQKEKQILVTFSGGLEIYSIEKQIDDLIKNADNKLYHAKRNGKNQVVCKAK